MNQSVLGALRGIAYLVLFTVFSALIGLIPDILTQLPYVGGLVTPTISGMLVAIAALYEHKLAAQLGYNLSPAQASGLRPKTGAVGGSTTFAPPQKQN